MDDVPVYAPISDDDRAAAVVRHVVRVTAAYTGRGPSKARAEMGADVITVILRDTLTTGERSLVGDGQSELVIGLRRSFQQTMRAALVEGVEAITGRSVTAFLSDHHLDPDVAVGTFVLAPLGLEVDGVEAPRLGIQEA